MKVLDLPDEQDNPVRQMLLKQDDNTLEELAKQSKQEIQISLMQISEKKTIELEQTESQKQDVVSSDIKQENKTIDQKLSKIKQAFPQSILDKNPDIADKFKLVDNLEDPAEKDKILQEILQILKSP